MKIIYNDGTVAECPAEDELHVIRHSAAHILAQAIKHLYPQAHFAYGPATEKGFHYDVDLGDVKLSDEDFPARLQFLADRSLPRFMHYETAMFAASHLTDRLTALMQ